MHTGHVKTRPDCLLQWSYPPTFLPVLRHPRRHLPPADFYLVAVLIDVTCSGILRADGETPPYLEMKLSERSPILKQRGYSELITPYSTSLLPSPSQPTAQRTPVSLSPALRSMTWCGCLETGLVDGLTPPWDSAYATNQGLILYCLVDCVNLSL